MKLLSFFTALLLSFPNSLASQQPASSQPASSTQATTLLTQSLSALTGSVTLNDVTLSGTAQRIAGSGNESGTGVLKALASGAARSDLTLPAGPRSEIENLTTAPPTGFWSGPDGVSHAIASHNLLTEPAWFFPAFVIARRLSDPSFVATYVGQEIHNGQAVQHVSVSQTMSFPDPPGGPTFAHLTQVDFFLNTTTLFPVAITFSTHPDNNARIDIPVEINFSNYTSVNGTHVAFHIQQSLNGSLILDFQAQSVAPNSGLSASTFNSL